MSERDNYLDHVLTGLSVSIVELRELLDDLIERVTEVEEYLSEEQELSPDGTVPEQTTQP